jgi:hypothetical protein
MWLIRVLGVIYLLFRIWLVEIRVKPFLHERARFISRWACYLLGGAMIFDFDKSIVGSALNLTIIMATPGFIIISLIYDSSFFLNFWKQHPELMPRDAFWCVIERLTLHFPVIGIGIWMFVTGIGYFVQNSIVVVLLTGVFIFGPYFAFDERWRKKIDWPFGLILFIIMVSIWIIVLVLVLI